MATKKISELTTVPSLDGTETFPILKSGFNYKMTVAQIKSWIGNATSSLAGLLSASDKSKLDSIETGATANASNALLRDRSTHTGTQAASTITGLADVATSGDYDDLTGKPSYATVATTGAYSDLTGKPSLAAVATSGSYNDLTGKPTLDTDWQTWQHLPITPFVSAAGTTSAAATLITKAVCQVSTVSAGATGIRIPSSMTLGATFTIINSTTSALNLYPPTGGQINYAGADVPLSVPSYNTFRVILVDAGAGIYQQL